MVKNNLATDKGEQTRQQIFGSALQLFRERGFDATTMQAIATHAGLVKSAAYYYFPSKESLIHAYYEKVQAEQEMMCAARFASTKVLVERLSIALTSKFDLTKNDRGLLGVVFRYTGEPQHPLSCLGSGTEDIRRRSTQVFCDAIADEKLPNDLREILPVAMWALQMGLLVMFLYDTSEAQLRTRRLADGALNLTLKLLGLAKLPILKPIRKTILSLLKDAKLLPESDV
jgi:AcrR family transcriptional regulator